MVLGIAPVAIIDRQLPFEYTITSRSTDVVVMAQPVQNINHSAFRSMFEREKLSGNNFNDWFRQLKLVLRVEKKMYVIEQPLPAAPAADSQAQVLSQWNAVYDAYNEVACLILGSMTPELHRQFENSSPYDMIKELKSMFEKQVGVERFDLIQTFHACKQEEGKPVAAYVLQMKGYVDQLERLGYMLPQDLIVGLILNGHTKDFTGCGLPKKAETPQVMTIKGGKIQKANKKSLKAKGKGKANGKGKDKQVYIPKPKNPKPSAKEHPAKDDTCHHYKEVGHWKRNCPVYLAELLKKKKQVGSASSSVIFTIELFAFPNKSWVYDTGCVEYGVSTSTGYGISISLSIRSIQSKDYMAITSLGYGASCDMEFAEQIYNLLKDLNELRLCYALSTTFNLVLGNLFHTRLYNLSMPEDIECLISEDHFIYCRARFMFNKRKCSLRVEEEKIIFKNVKPASSIIKRVYMLSLRERMEIDLETRLMGETLVINRSLDPFLEDYIELNDLNKPFELRRNQGNDLMPTIEEGEVIKEFRTRNEDLDTRIDDYPSYCDDD
ncbi:helitron helicase-like domain-containing protein [Tanacetum coccineum]